MENPEDRKLFCNTNYGENMIEILKSKMINKGTLLAVCDVNVIPWKITLKEIKIFQKGSSRWLGMPCRDYLNEKNEKQYYELVAFEDDTAKNAFRDSVLLAFDKMNQRTQPDQQHASRNTNNDVPF